MNPEMSNNFVHLQSHYLLSRRFLFFFVKEILVIFVGRNYRIFCDVISMTTTTGMFRYTKYFDRVNKKKYF